MINTPKTFNILWHENNATVHLGIGIQELSQRGTAVAIINLGATD